MIKWQSSERPFKNHLDIQTNAALVMWVEKTKREQDLAHLEIKLLGPFQVLINGESVTGFDSDKVRALLAGNSPN